MKGKDKPSKGQGFSDGSRCSSSSDLVAYHKALEAFHFLTVDTTLSLDEKILKFLALCQQRFGTDFAIVSKVEGNDYQVLYVECANQEIQSGQHFALENTYCVHTLAASEVIGFYHTGLSDVATHPCYQNFQLETYLGAPIYVHDRIFGTLNFSSPKPRSEAFTKQDRTLVGLVASWIGFELSRQAFQNSLQEKTTQAEKATEAKSLFLTTMSHELRTLMNGIMGFTDLLLKSGLDPKQQRYADLSWRSSKFLLTMLDDLVDFGCIEAGELQLKKEYFDFYQLIEETVELMHRSNHKKQHVPISFNIAKDQEFPLRIFRREIKSVFRKLWDTRNLKSSLQYEFSDPKITKCSITHPINISAVLKNS